MTPTPSIEVDVSTFEWTARWVGWGKGRYHVQEKGSKHTACGREIPEGELRTSIYSGWKCSRCEKHEELFQAAEDYRKHLYDAAQDHRDARRERNRQGVFSVYRCKRCGVQHHPSSGPGVPFCVAENHEADLEIVEAIGPAFSKLTPTSEQVA